MKIEQITNKQLEILVLLYRFRFLNRTHVQQFLNHKNHSRITPWLKDLTDRQIINRIYSQTIGDINKPAIYYLANKAKQILKDDERCRPEILNRIYREKHRSEAFRNHWLFMADMYFHFQLAAQKQNATSNFYTATDLTNIAYTPLPLPDAYITIKDFRGTKRYFLDVFNDNTPMFAIKRRILQYTNYYLANYWQDHNKYPFPKILLICPSVRIQKSLLRFIPQVLEDEEAEISFFLGLKDNIQKDGLGQDTWESV